MRIRIQRIAILLMLLALLLIPLGLSSFASRHKNTLPEVAQVEVFNERWWGGLKEGIENKNWKHLEEALVNTPSYYGQRAAVFAFIAYNINNIEDNKELKVLFDRLLDFQYKHDFGNEFNLSLALSTASESRLGRVIAAEEQELQQILELAEKNIATLGRQTASAKLRDILARMSYPLEFSRIRLACFRQCSYFPYQYYESNFRQDFGHRSMGHRNLDAYLKSKVAIMERLIKLAIQLNVNASEIADLAFNPLFKSAGKIDYEADRSKSIWLIISALNNLAKDFPQSPVPQTLSKRLKASGLVATPPTPQPGDIQMEEEMKLEQALRIAETTQAFDNPKSVTSRLRGVLSQVSTPLELPDEELRPFAAGGEVADQLQVQERLRAETMARLKRVIILAIQLNAPDLADIAFTHTLKSAQGGENVSYIARTLKDVGKQYPDSRILQGLKARSGKR
jgi:hypothetical protein